MVAEMAHDPAVSAWLGEQTEKDRALARQALAASVAEARAMLDANTYAVIDSDNDVVDTWDSAEDGGHPDVQREGERRTGAGQRWVYVDGPCVVGDRLAVDEDGNATVLESE